MKKTTKSILVAACAALALSLTACGGADNKADKPAAGSDAAAGDATGQTFIYLTNDPIGVNKFLELGKIGMEKAAAELGGETKTFEGSDEASLRSNLEAAVAEAPALVVMTTFDFTDLSKEFAEKYPDQKFLLIDACPEAAPENLYCAVFREQEAAYLLGVEAAALTKTKKVGSVGAVDIPFIHRYTDNFRDGAIAQDATITDKQLFIGGNNPFSDPAKGKEQALALIATGVDHLFAVGVGSNSGIFEAAKEKGIVAYGADVNQCPDAPGVVQDGYLKLMDAFLPGLTKTILDGTAEQITSFGLKEGGMDIIGLRDDVADSQCLIAQNPELIEKLKQVKVDIVEGKINPVDPMATAK